MAVIGKIVFSSEEIQFPCRVPLLNGEIPDEPTLNPMKTHLPFFLQITILANWAALGSFAQDLDPAQAMLNAAAFESNDSAATLDIEGDRPLATQSASHEIVVPNGTGAGGVQLPTQFAGSSANAAGPSAAETGFTSDPRLKTLSHETSPVSTAQGAAITLDRATLAEIIRTEVAAAIRKEKSGAGSSVTTPSLPPAPSQGEVLKAPAVTDDESYRATQAAIIAAQAAQAQSAAATQFRASTR